jgi:hypothetical protein
VQQSQHPLHILGRLTANIPAFRPGTSIDNKATKNIDHRSSSTSPQLEDEESSVNVASINSSASLEKKTVRSLVASFSEKLGGVRNSCIGGHHVTEIDHAIKKLEFNVIVMGSPRVGKSQLINALCGEKELARTSSSLNSCTKEIQKYALKTDEQEMAGLPSCTVNIYDTPGVESWTNDAGKDSMARFIEETNPICMIYCASPGSFSDLSQLHSILQECKEKHIFCACVCTNMWSGNQRDTVIQEFEKQLYLFGTPEDKYSNDDDTSQPHKTTFFGKGALCTMVNSNEYCDLAWSPVPRPVRGVDELIHGIMESLDDKKILGWCAVVLNQRSFWTKMTQKTNSFFHSHFAYVRNRSFETAENVASFVSKIAWRLFQS